MLSSYAGMPACGLSTLCASFGGARARAPRASRFPPDLPRKDPGAGPTRGHSRPGSQAARPSDFQAKTLHRAPPTLQRCRGPSMRCSPCAGTSIGESDSAQPSREFAVGACRCPAPHRWPWFCGTMPRGRMTGPWSCPSDSRQKVRPQSNPVACRSPCQRQTRAVATTTSNAARI
jgi:hypothetical protein